jgi:cyclohexa-1,5-dienecarbonyl-CoA hydratase
MSPLVRTIEERNGAWLRVVIDRPPANLLSLDMVRALTPLVRDAAAPLRKWVTFEGAGDHFSYGAKIEEHVPGPMEMVLPEAHALLRHVLQFPCPTAALVQGQCLGGGFELALACDVIVAVQGSSFGLPEIRLAAFPPAGAALLPTRIGTSRATPAILSGAPQPAEAWHDIGLVTVLAPRGGLLRAAGAWFDDHLAGRSAVALSAAARAARRTLRAAAEPAIEELERLYLDEVLTTADAAEGVRAFVEKRPPQWKDR